MHDHNNPAQNPQHPFLPPNVHSQLNPHFRRGITRPSRGPPSIPPPEINPDDRTTYFSSNEPPPASALDPSSTDAPPNDTEHTSPERSTKHSAFDPSTKDILTVSDILDHVLVPDLTPDVLEMAHYWTRDTAERNTQMIVSQATAGRVYVRTKPLTGMSGLRLVVFTLRSHDQGWSDNRQEHGTYQGSFTWFKVVLKRAKKSEKLDSASGSDEKEGKDDSKANEEEYEEVASRQLIQNVHGSKYDAVHTLTWSTDPAATSITGKYKEEMDETGNAKPNPQLEQYTEEEKHEIKDFLKQMQDGDRLEVQAWAQYPGWINHVAGIRVDVYCGI